MFESRFNPKWAVMALRTITSGHRNLREISYNVSTFLLCKELEHSDRERDYPGWLELDRVFMKLWESYSIRPKVQYYPSQASGLEAARSYMENLFPETTKEGVIGMSVGGP